VSAERLRGLVIGAVVVAAIALGMSFVALKRPFTTAGEAQVLVRKISGLLLERERILSELVCESDANTQQDCLEFYLVQIRKDGAALHASQRRGLSRLAANQVAMLALAEAYEPMAKREEYASGLNELREYVLAWNERWNALFEVFMAGGNLPPGHSPFPTTFADALLAERAGLE
jgi:hypothetical protein